MRRWLWVLAGVLLLAGITVVAVVRPALISVENAEQALAEAQQSGDLNAEGAALENLARIKPEENYWQKAGEVYFMAGNLESALKALQKAESAGKLTGEGLVLLGDGLSLSAEPTQAVEKWRKATTMGELEGYARLANYYREEKNWSEFETLLMEWVRADDTDGEPFLLYGLLRTAQGSVNSLEELHIAEEKNPDMVKTILQIENAVLEGSLSSYSGYLPMIVGRALGNCGYWDFAEIAFNLALKTTPDYAEAWAFLAEAKYQQGEGGEEEIQKALALNPASVVVRALYAMQLRREGKTEEALPYLQANATAEPEQVVWRMEIGATLAELGQINEALVEFQSATEMDPKNADTWKVLATFCIQHNFELRTIGLEAAREALSLEPEDAEALDLMGWAFFLLDDSTSAERFLHRALEEDESYVNAYLHLGQLYLKAQQNSLAYQNLKRASQLAEEESETQLLANRLLEQYFGEVEKTP
jgi:tetratricopeptide (TPR) repeat protein